jgi:predicted nucleic acid-binding protein
LGEVVVDASAALKWVLEEGGTSQALSLLDEDVLHAPDFLLVEVANVLWAKVRRRIFTRADADQAYEAIAAVPFFLTPLGELVEPARSLSYTLDLTVYDGVYAALAQAKGCPLATADKSLAEAVDKSGMLASALLIG